MTSTSSKAPSKKALWAGRGLGWFASLFFLVDGAVKVAQLEPVMQINQQLGIPLETVPGIGLLLIACTLVYLVPRTSILGAILLTGYLGGAVLTHLRVGQPVYFPIGMGVMVWAAAYLRDPDLQALVPWRR